MAPQVAEIVSVLGGSDALGGRRIRTERDLDALVHDGLPVSALEHAIAALGTTQGAVLAGVGIPRSTLRRRRGGAEARLGDVESERVIRLGRIAAIGEAALGSLAAVGAWLQRPNRALGGVEPMTLLRTEIGGREVEAVLVRALLGGYS